MPKSRNGNKFGVAPKDERTYKGVVFHSKSEMLRFIDLERLQLAGHIRKLRRQVRFPLEAIVAAHQDSETGMTRYHKKLVGHYTADFVYERHYVSERDGEEMWLETVEDLKGAATTASSLRIKLFEALYDKTVLITRPKGSRRKAWRPRRA